MSDSTNRSSSLVGYGANPGGRPDTDFYATPSWATQSLLNNEIFPDKILEPCCGDGAISKVLAERGYLVTNWDKYDYGVGAVVNDFLYPTLDQDFGSVVTNPPYRLAETFIKKSLRLTKAQKGKVAMLLKLQFLEGQARGEWFPTTPLKSVYVFSKQLSFSRNNVPLANSGMMAFAWYVWDWEYVGLPTIEWIS